MPNYLPSSFPTTLYLSVNFLESCGCILFDFRHTTIDPFNPPDTSNYPLQSNHIPTPHPHILLIHSRSRQQYLLPKGSRNISKPYSATAIRETTEETGLRVSLLPVTLHSRATSTDPSDDRTDRDGFTLDEVRAFHGVTEAFMLMLRQTHNRTPEPSVSRSEAHEVPGEVTNPTAPETSTSVQTADSGEGVKLIWWFIGVVDEDQGSEDEIKVRQGAMDPGCEVVSVPMGEAVEKCSFADDARVVKGAIEVVGRTFGWDVGGGG